MDRYEVIIENDKNGGLIIDIFPDYKSAHSLKISLLKKDGMDERQIRIESHSEE